MAMDLKTLAAHLWQHMKTKHRLGAEAQDDLRKMFAYLTDHRTQVVVVRVEYQGPGPDQWTGTLVDGFTGTRVGIAQAQWITILGRLDMAGGGPLRVPKIANDDRDDLPPITSDRQAYRHIDALREAVAESPLVDLISEPKRGPPGISLLRLLRWEPGPHARLKWGPWKVPPAYEDEPVPGI